MIYSTEKGSNYVKHTFEQVKTKITNICTQLYDYENFVHDSVIITLDNGAIITQRKYIDSPEVNYVLL